MSNDDASSSSSHHPLSGRESLPMERLAGWVTYTYGPGWSLPSISPACLALKLYFAFLGYRVRDEACNNRAMVPAHFSLPVLARTDAPATETVRVKWGLSDIVEWLADCGLGTSPESLPLAEKSKSTELLALHEAALEPALLFNWYSEPLNFPIVAQAYARHLTFPLSVVETSGLKSEVAAYLQARNCLNAAVVYRRATEAYQALSFELGNKPFLLGAKPSFVDAVVIAHLALALHAPMDPEASNLMMSVQRFPNLVSYVNNALRIYLRSEPSRSHGLVERPLFDRLQEYFDKSVKPAAFNSLPFLAGAFAVLTLGVVLHTGMTRVSPPPMAYFSV